jgi:transcription initiation factor TFIIB
MRVIVLNVMVEKVRPRDEDEEEEEDENEPRVKQEEKDCPECNSENTLVREQSEMVCEECGYVSKMDMVDHGPEWRAFDQEEKEQKSRVGSPTTQAMHDKGLTTTIDWKDKDAYGNMISSEKRNTMKRLRKWQERIRTKNSEERNLQFALSEIDRMASALGLPRNIRETASVIYRQALKKDLIRGRSIEGVASASVYAACRQENIPRSLEEITAASRVDKKEIGRTFRYVKKEIGLELEPVDPKKYVPRFCSKLDLDEEVQQKAKEIIDVTARNGLLSGKSPTGFAAASIYAASLLCNDKKTQKQISEVADVTEVTIRNRYQEQMNFLNDMEE